MSMPGQPVPLPRKRVIAYVDGFNLYYGLRESEWRRFYWLDLPALARSLILPYQDLVQTKYFTSRIVKPPGKHKRQGTYLEALEAHCGRGVKMYFGYNQSDPWTCKSCGKVALASSEKKTDVHIAVEIMMDAFTDAFDTALVVTADSDLVPPIQAVKKHFPGKRIVVFFPPKRHSFELKQEAHAAFTIGRAKFAGAQMPDRVQKSDGTELCRPAKWMHEETVFGKALETALNKDE